MAGTRNAPTVNGTETYLEVSIGLIDTDGTKRSLAFKAETGTTNAEIEAVVAALQEITNASIYRVTVAENYEASPLSTLADNAVVQSVFSNVVILFKDLPAQNSQEAYVPAPIDALFTPGTKNVDLANTNYEAYRDAVDVILGASFNPISVRYTERRQMNQRQNTA